MADGKWGTLACPLLRLTPYSMGLSFKKRIKILPGLNINLSKSGLGLSAGPKGAKVSLGADGKTRVSVGKGSLRYSKTLESGTSKEPSQIAVYIVMVSGIVLLGLLVFTVLAIAFS